MVPLDQRPVVGHDVTPVARATAANASSAAVDVGVGVRRHRCHAEAGGARRNGRWPDRLREHAARRATRRRSASRSALSPSMTGMMCVSPSAPQARPRPARGAAARRSRAVARGARARRRPGAAPRPRPRPRPAQGPSCRRSCALGSPPGRRAPGIRRRMPRRRRAPCRACPSAPRPRASSPSSSASPAPRGPEHAGRVGLVQEHARMIGTRQRDEVTQGGPVAVHGEDRVGDDQAAASLWGRGQDALRVPGRRGGDRRGRRPGTAGSRR